MLIKFVRNMNRLDNAYFVPVKTQLDFYMNNVKKDHILFNELLKTCLFGQDFTICQNDFFCYCFS
jgi:hypothetical protein